MMTERYDFEKIRRLLIEGFSDRQLRRFCFDTPGFRAVYDELAQNSGKNEIIDQLLDYAHRERKIELLLDWTRKNNFARYEQYQPYLATSSQLPVSGNVPGSAEYDPIRIQTFLADKVDLKDFCFVLEIKVRSQYAYRMLPGETPADKSRELVLRVTQNEELGELVFQLSRYWLERVHGNPQVLQRVQLTVDLEIYEEELKAQDNLKKAEQVRQMRLKIEGGNTPLPSRGSSRASGASHSSATLPITNQDNQTTRPTVFISYSHQDEKEKNELLIQLGVLASADLIDLWSDDRIGAGADWEAEISQVIMNARVAILLISANFLTSNFIFRKEVPELLKRRDREGLTVFPVIAKACHWQAVDWLAKMNVRPKNGQPVWSDGGSHADEDLAAIAKEVASIVGRKD